MTAERFNPLKNAKQLEKAGLSKDIAEELVQQQADLITSELVSKEYLKSSLAELENRFYRNIFGMLIVFGIIQHLIGK